MVFVQKSTDLKGILDPSYIKNLLNTVLKNRLEAMPLLHTPNPTRNQPKERSGINMTVTKGDRASFLKEKESKGVCR